MAQTRPLIRLLEQSINPGSIVKTNALNEQEYVSPGANGTILTVVGGVPTWQAAVTPSFNLEDSLGNIEVINAGDTLLVTAGNGVTATVSATDLLTIAASLSADVGNDITFGSDGGLYLSKDSLLTNVTWDDATNNLILTFDNGSTVNVPIVDSISSWLADFTISDGTTTDIVNNHETVVFEGIQGIKTVVSANKVTFSLDRQEEMFDNLTTGNTVTVSIPPTQTLDVYRNGIRQTAGATNDYTVSGSTYTFTVAFGPSGGGTGADRIQIVYLIN